MLLTAREDLEQPGPKRVLANPARPKDLRRAAARLMQHAEEKMLDSNEVVAERPGLLLRVADGPTCRFGESLKHAASIPPPTPGGARPRRPAAVWRTSSRPQACVLAS